MQAKLIKRNGQTFLQIEVPYVTKDQANPSSSGKTLILATSGGNQPVSIDGEVVKIGVNAFVANPDA